MSTLSIELDNGVTQIAIAHDVVPRGVNVTRHRCACRRYARGVLPWDLEFDAVDLDEWCDFFFLNDVDLQIPEISIKPCSAFYLPDGRAALWVWSDASEQRLEEYVDRPVRPFGTHVYAESSGHA